MRAYKTEGIVIKRKNFGEADRIVTIFSRRNGKMQIKAKGVRRITSRRSSHIELLNYAVFNIYQGKSLPILTEVESKESFPGLKKDLKRIGYACHVCELIDGLCAENQESEEIFMLLGTTLRKLSKEENFEDIIYHFEIELLRLLGFHTPLNLMEEKIDTLNIIENILERKLKSRQIFPQMS